MITPIIHQMLKREDLARLVSVINCTSEAEGREAALALEVGAVDMLLDSEHSLNAVRGAGGAPAPLPLTLLWYIPVRASLRSSGENSVPLADLAATIPIVFLSPRGVTKSIRDQPGLAEWTRSIRELPDCSTAQAERAADCAAAAVWWIGCFPDFVRSRFGSGMLRAYADFAAGAFQLSARLLRTHVPEVSTIYEQTASEIELVREAIQETSLDYLGKNAHDPEARLDRFLRRLN